MSNFRKTRTSISVAKEQQNIHPGFAFLIGHCQLCGYVPTGNYQKNADHLYHCERCGYPMEFHALMELMIRFEKELESDSQLSDTMIQQQVNVIK